jgi:hypothetical protein
VWTVLQDHENGDLLFAGTEFGLFVSVDGGGRWVQMKGGLPVIQVRDMAIQKRENDLVLGTFGRGFYVLDDYSALRAITPQALAAEAQLFPLRDAYSFSSRGMAPAGSAGIGTLSGNTTVANPPAGAVFTYNVGAALPDDAKLVLTITDQQGRQVRRMDVEKAPGLRRVVWNLRGDPPAAGQGGGRGAQGAAGAANAEQAAAIQAFLAGRGGRGGGGAAAEPGLYRAQLGKQVGDKVEPIGEPQAFRVTAIQ